MAKFQASQQRLNSDGIFVEDETEAQKTTFQCGRAHGPRRRDKGGKGFSQRLKKI